MATTCTRKAGSVSGVIAAKYSEGRVSESFNLVSDTPITDPVEAYYAARSANPSQFPQVGAAWPTRPTYGLFAKRFSTNMVSSKGTQWEISVEYEPLEPDEPNRDGVSDNPLAWPRTYRWDWVEYEEAIKEAYNVEEFTGIEREALTLGPVVNPAGQEYVDGLFDVVREAVLVIRWNVATLDDVAAIEAQYQRTTNTDTVFGIAPRRWKYLGLEDGDAQVHNEIPYRPVTVRVQLTKTTDRRLLSVGWKELDDDGLPNIPAMVEEHTETGVATGNRIPASEPRFLNNAGKFVATPRTDVWRYLDEVNYAPLLED